MDGEAYGGREIGRPSPEQGSRGTLLPPIAAKTVKAVGGLGGRREEDGGLRQKLAGRLLQDSPGNAGDSGKF